MKDPIATPPKTPVNHEAKGAATPEPYKPSASQTTAPITPDAPAKKAGLPKPGIIVLVVVVLCALLALAIYQFNHVSKKDYKAATMTSAIAYDILGTVNDNIFGPNIVDSTSKPMLEKYNTKLSSTLAQYQKEHRLLARMKAMRGTEAKQEYDIFDKRSNKYESLVKDYLDDTKTLATADVDCGGLVTTAGNATVAATTVTAAQLDALAKRAAECVSTAGKVPQPSTSALRSELSLFKTSGPALAANATTLAQAMRTNNASGIATATQQLTATVGTFTEKTAANNDDFSLKVLVNQPSNELASLRSYLERQSH